MTQTSGVQDFARIAVIGGGAFGTALAQTLRLAGRNVQLWARNAAVVAEINEQRTNAVYLPGVKLDAQLSATTDPGMVREADLILLVTPAQATRAAAQLFAPNIRAGVPVVLCAKGIEQSTAKRLSTVVAEVLPQTPLAVLSGPAFAVDVVRGLLKEKCLARARTPLW